MESNFLHSPVSVTYIVSIFHPGWDFNFHCLQLEKSSGNSPNLDTQYLKFESIFVTGNGILAIFQ